MKLKPCQEFKDTCNDYANTVKERDRLKAEMENHKICVECYDPVLEEGAMYCRDCKQERDRFRTALDDIEKELSVYNFHYQHGATDVKIETIEELWEKMKMIMDIVTEALKGGK